MVRLRQPREVYRVLTDEEYLASDDWREAPRGRPPIASVRPHDASLVAPVVKHTRAPRRVLAIGGLLCGGLSVLLLAASVVLGPGRSKRAAAGPLKLADRTRRRVRVRIQRIAGATRSRRAGVEPPLGGSRVRAPRSTTRASGTAAGPRFRVLSVSGGRPPDPGVSANVRAEPAPAEESGDASAATAEFGFER
jgi:hypothetical protein